MAKKEQILILDPEEEITFRGDFTAKVCKTNLSISNPTDQAIAFKVKTTAPKRYCVRPNSGKIEPSDTALVSVVLQPSSSNDDLKKHKFMVQSIELASADERSVDEIFKSTSSAELMSKKLFCNFIKEDEEAEEVTPPPQYAESPSIQPLPVDNTRDEMSSPEVEIRQPEPMQEVAAPNPIMRPEIKAVPEEPKIIQQQKPKEPKPVLKNESKATSQSSSSSQDMEKLRVEVRQLQELNAKLAKEKKSLEIATKSSSQVQSDAPMDQSLMMKMMGIICFIGIIIGWLVSNMFCRC